MKLNKLKFLGAMAFVTILLDVVPSTGFINVGSVSITTLHIPVIITAIVLGPWYGALIGGLFGVISLLHALSREAIPMDVLFINPGISVLPRICIALCAGYLYKYLEKFSQDDFKPLAIAVSALAATFVNSLMVLSALYFLHPQELMEILAIPARGDLLSGLADILKFNTVIEAIAGVVISLLCIYGIQKFSKRKKKQPKMR